MAYRDAMGRSHLFTDSSKLEEVEAAHTLTGQRHRESFNRCVDRSASERTNERASFLVAARETTVAELRPWKIAPLRGERERATET